MPKRYFQKKVRKYRKRNNFSTVQKMAGDAVNTGLDYASKMGGTLGTVARTVKLIKNFVNVETKNYDTSISAQVANASYVYGLNDIAKGNDANQRNGDSIKMQKILLNCIFSKSPDATQTMIRYMIVYDKKPQLGSVSIDTVTGSTLGGATGLLNHNDENSSDRFIKLLDKRIVVSSGNGQIAFRKHVINLDVHAEWLNTDTNGQSFEKGKLLLLACTNEGTNFPSMLFSSRIKYFDN